MSDAIIVDSGGASGTQRKRETVGSGVHQFAPRVLGLVIERHLTWSLTVTDCS